MQGRLAASMVCGCVGKAVNACVLFVLFALDVSGIVLAFAGFGTGRDTLTLTGIIMLTCAVACSICRSTWLINVMRNSSLSSSGTAAMAFFIKSAFLIKAPSSAWA